MKPLDHSILQSMQAQAAHIFLPIIRKAYPDLVVEHVIGDFQSAQMKPDVCTVPEEGIARLLSERKNLSHPLRGAAAFRYIDGEPLTSLPELHDLFRKCTEIFAKEQFPTMMIELKQPPPKMVIISTVFPEVVPEVIFDSTRIIVIFKFDVFAFSVSRSDGLIPYFTLK